MTPVPLAHGAAIAVAKEEPKRESSTCVLPSDQAPTIGGMSEISPYAPDVGCGPNTRTFVAPWTSRGVKSFIETSFPLSHAILTPAAGGFVSVGASLSAPVQPHKSGAYEFASTQVARLGSKIQVGSMSSHVPRGTEKAKYVRGTAFGVERNDLYEELEENRYFVVLMAYDFQLLWKEKKHKLLWETRFSIGERHNAFDKALPVMVRYASQYFGQNSNGLLRTRVPEGTVQVKDPTLIEFIPDPGK